MDFLRVTKSFTSIKGFHAKHTVNEYESVSIDDPEFQKYIERALLHNIADLIFDTEGEKMVIQDRLSPPKGYIFSREIIVITDPELFVKEFEKALLDFKYGLGNYPPTLNDKTKLQD